MSRRSSGAWAAPWPTARAPAPLSGKKVVLQVGWYENLDSLNPFIGQQNVAYDIYRLNYDFLVNYDADTLAPIPGLATHWSHSSDGKTWTFKIRQGVRWQDGQPLTASDVAFTFNYIIRNQMTAYTNYTQFIKDAVALDPTTVRFDCSRPKAEHPADVGAHHPPAHLGQDPALLTRRTSSRTPRP